MNKSLSRTARSGLCLICAVLLATTACENLADEAASVSPPVEGMRVVNRDGQPAEIWVHIQKGLRLDSLVDLSFFDGFTDSDSLEVAKRRLGQPSKVREQSDMGGHLKIYLYPVPKGEIGFIAVPSSGGKQNQVWAFPTNQSPDSVILDASLRTQLVRKLPADHSARVFILRDIGWGGVTLKMRRDRVEYLILGPRDGEN